MIYHLVGKRAVSTTQSFVVLFTVVDILHAWLQEKNNAAYLQILIDSGGNGQISCLTSIHQDKEAILQIIMLIFKFSSSSAPLTNFAYNYIWRFCLLIPVCVSKMVSVECPLYSGFV